MEKKLIKISFSLNLIIIITLFFGKYYFYGIPLEQIDFLYTGNILFYLIYVIILAGQFVLIKNSNRRLAVLNIMFSLSAFVLVLLSIISYYYNILFFSERILLIQSNKVLRYVLIVVASKLQIFIAFFNLYKVIDKKKVPFFKALKGTSFVILAIFIIAFFYNIIFDRTYRTSNLENKETAFVLGAAVWKNNQPSPLYESRLEKTREIFEKNKVDKIFLTGGKAPGELSESEVGKNYLIQKRIPENKILLESITSSTLEQILYLKNNFRKAYSRIVIISNRFHIPRIRQMLNFFNMDVQILSVEKEFKKEHIYNYVRDSIALAIFWIYGI